MLIVVASVLAIPAVGVGQPVERYTLPLVGPYAIHHDPRLPAAGQGSRQLVELRRSSGGRYGFTTLVAHVERYACDGAVIVGKAREGYFLLNAAGDGARPRFFPTVEPWREALAAAGVPPDIYLDDPDARATTMPSQVIRPWKYRVVSGFLGQSDEAWSLIVQCVGLLICVVIGWRTRNDFRLLPVAIVAGVGANIVGQILIAGGGPAAFVGFLVLPVVYLFAGHLGRVLRRATDRLDWHPIRNRHSASRSKPSLWRDRVVIILAALLALAGIQCVMTAGALPFYGGEKLSVAIATGWSDPLDWIRDSLLRTQFLGTVFGIAVIFLYATCKHPLLRWTAIVLAMILGLPGLAFPEIMRETHEFLTQHQDGESWEFAAFVVAGWWGLLWLVAGASELFLPIVRPATNRPRGFEPLLTGSSATPSG